MTQDKPHEKPKVTIKIEHGDMKVEKELAIEKWEDISSCGTILTPASDVIICDAKIQFSDNVRTIGDDETESS